MCKFTTSSLSDFYLKRLVGFLLLTFVLVAQTADAGRKHRHWRKKHLLPRAFSRSLSRPSVSIAFEQLVEPIDVAAKQAPKSDKAEITKLFDEYFNNTRGFLPRDVNEKERVANGILAKLKQYAIGESFINQTEVPPYGTQLRPNITNFNRNIVTILPGKQWRTKQDRIVLIGAHWDTTVAGPGTVDNGSGSVALLELARLMSVAKCKFNHTVMLVWFDYEEIGLVGSYYFVHKHLMSEEIDRYGAKFVGAYIMDMVLVRDRGENTQGYPLQLAEVLPEFVRDIEADKQRGDWIGIWARKTWDEPLANAFKNSWTSMGYEPRTVKTLLPELPLDRPPSHREHEQYKFFSRSDQASFWFPTDQMLAGEVTGDRSNFSKLPMKRQRMMQMMRDHTSFNAVLITDMSPYRESYSRCYHDACDDKHYLTDDNVAFMQQVVDSMMLTLMRVGQGQCAASR